MATCILPTGRCQRRVPHKHPAHADRPTNILPIAPLASCRRVAADAERPTCIPPTPITPQTSCQRRSPGMHPADGSLPTPIVPHASCRRRSRHVHPADFDRPTCILTTQHPAIVPSQICLKESTPTQYHAVDFPLELCMLPQSKLTLNVHLFVVTSHIGIVPRER